VIDKDGDKNNKDRDGARLAASPADDTPEFVNPLAGLLVPTGDLLEEHALLGIERLAHQGD
jgi:hypothetical protein